MDFISFASWTGMLSLFETYFGTWHRIRQQDKAYSNIKILLYHWLLIYVHVSKPTGGRRPCDINCSKFFPAPFWSHNQKVVWVSLLYLHTKSNADYLPINSTLILSQSLDSDPRLQGYAIKGYGPRLTSGNRFAVNTIQSLAPTVPSYRLFYRYLFSYPRTDIYQ